MSLQVVRSLGVGRFLNWGAVDAKRVLGGIFIFWDNRVLDLLELECGGFSISCCFRNCSLSIYSHYLPLSQKKANKKWEFCTYTLIMLAWVCWVHLKSLVSMFDMIVQHTLNTLVLQLAYLFYLDLSIYNWF